MHYMVFYVYMYLQHILKAPMDGIVDRVTVQAGQIVQQNGLVVKLTDTAAAAQA